jgi:hypothetical protein
MKAHIKMKSMVSTYRPPVPTKADIAFDAQIQRLADQVTSGFMTFTQAREVARLMDLTR